MFCFRIHLRNSKNDLHFSKGIYAVTKHGYFKEMKVKFVTFSKQYSSLIYIFIVKVSVTYDQYRF